MTSPPVHSNKSVFDLKFFHMLFLQKLLLASHAVLMSQLQIENFWQPWLIYKHSTPTLLLLCLLIKLMDPEIQTSVLHSESILQGRNPAERCSQTKRRGQVSCQSILSPAGSLKKELFDCHVMLIIQNKFIFTQGAIKTSSKFATQ